MRYKVPDPDFEKRVRGSFTRQKLMRTIGAELTGSCLERRRSACRIGMI